MTGHPPTRARASVVIPAHNEASVIARCLQPLVAPGRRGELELVVVSNGSTDETATIAAGVLADVPGARVEAIPTPSKIAALRVGDEVAETYPRIYLDADISVDGDVVVDLAAALAAADGPMVGAPALRVDAAASSWAVRSYHRVWRELPYVTSGVIGTGVYAVNAAGGRRLGRFPDVINDDEWVRRHFTASERVISPGEFIARAPRTLRALVRQRARVETGNREFPEGVHALTQPPATAVADLRAAWGRPGVSPVDIAVYAAVVVTARVVAKWRRLRGRSGDWSTDTTTRQVVTSNPVGQG